MTDQEDHATVRELADFRVEVERRFSRIEKTLLVLVVVNVIPKVPGVSLPAPAEAAASLIGSLPL